MGEITGNGTLVSGLGGWAGYGEINLWTSDDWEYRVDISAVFENGLKINGVTYDDLATQFAIDTNGAIRFGDTNDTWNPGSNFTWRSASHYFDYGGRNVAQGETTVRPIIAPYMMDFVHYGDGSGMFVDVDPTEDVVTVTWLDVPTYGYNWSYATDSRYSFQVQLFDRGNFGFDIVLRYDTIDPHEGYFSYAEAGINLGDFWASPLGPSGQTTASDLDTRAGNTGETGLWVYEYRVDSLEAGDVTLSAAEDTQIRFDAAALLANSTTGEAAGLTVTAVTALGNGTAQLTGDGAVLFTPDQDFNGTAHFRFEVSDGEFTKTAEATVTVTPVNDAPTARPDGVEGVAGGTSTFTAAELLGNDVDIEGDTLSIKSVGGGTGGTAELTPDGAVRFAATPGHTGAASFTYTVTDGQGGTDTATVTVGLAEPVSEIVARDLDGTDGVIFAAGSDGLGTSGMYHRAAMVGDVNGDGLDDMVLMQKPYSYNASYSYFETDSFLIFGSADFASGITADLRGGTVDIHPLLSPNGSDYVRIAPFYESSGSANAFTGAAGDVNGDGYDDFFMTHRRGSLGTQDAEGLAYLVYGGPSYGGLEDVTTLGSGSVRFDGSEVYDQLGAVGSGTFDFNGDGKLDLVMGASGHDVFEGAANKGAAYVFFGENDTLNPFYSADDAGLTIVGPTFPSGSFIGGKLAVGGDLNGDGMDDLLLGLERSSVAEGVMVVYGRDYESEAGDEVNLSALSESGYVSGIGDPTGLSKVVVGGDGFDFIGDINGDGYDDFAVGDSYATSATGGKGRVGVFFGGPDMLDHRLTFDMLDGTNGFMLEGGSTVSFFGSSLDGIGEVIKGLGDINGDGFDDFATISVGAVPQGGNDGNGAVYVVYGSGDGFPPALNVSDLDGTFGFVIDGDYDMVDSGSTFTDIAGGGDVNGDGLDDILLTTVSDLVYLVYGFETDGATGVPRLLSDQFTMFEDTTLTLDAADLLGNDIDDGPLTAISAVTAAFGGTVTLEADGALRFVAEAGFTGAAGFSYSVTDADGNTATGSVDVTVEEVPVDAVITFDQITGTLSEAGPLDRVGGRLTVIDPNSGEAQIGTTGTFAGTYGSFLVQSDGLWRFTLDPDASAFDSLAEGQSAVEQLDVFSADGTARQTLTVTIDGVDEISMSLAGTAYTVSGDPSKGYATGVEAVEGAGGQRYIAWTYSAGDSSGSSVNAVVKSPDGSPYLTERQINDRDALDQGDVQLAYGASGRWFAAFTDVVGGGGVDIGLKSYPNFFGTTYSSSESDIPALTDPDLLALASGGFALVGKEMGSADAEIFLRFFDETGTATGNRLSLAQVGQGDGEPSLAQLGDGTLVLAYTDGGNRIMVQHLSPTGAPLGGALDAGVATNNGYGPQVTALTGGGYVVSWDMGQETGGIAALVYDAKGAQVGDLLTFDDTADIALGHSVTALANGSFALAWARLEVGGAFEVMVQAVDGFAVKSDKPMLAGEISPALYDESFFEMLPVSLVGDGTHGLSLYYPKFNESLGVMEIVGQTIDIDLPIPMDLGDDAFTVSEAQEVASGLDLFANDAGFALEVTAVDGQAMTGSSLHFSQSYGTITLFKSGSVTVSFDDPADSFQKGETDRLSFDVTIADKSGETQTASLTLLIAGESDGLDLKGTSGDDDLRSGEGDDSQQGLDGMDTLSGGFGDDVLDGGADDDLLDTGGGADLALGGAGDDYIHLAPTGGFASGMIAFNISSSGQVGTHAVIDLAPYQALPAVVDGGADWDAIYLSDASEAFFLHDSYSAFNAQVGLGTDYEGRANAARVLGIEEINAGEGDDLIDLTSPDFSLAGEDIFLFGDEGDDIIWGSDANEWIEGGAGNDTIFGGTGADLLVGGSGADVFEFTRTSIHQTIADFTAGDGDILRFYNTANAQFDAASLEQTADGFRIHFADLSTGVSDYLDISLQTFDGMEPPSLAALSAAIEVI